MERARNEQISMLIERLKRLPIQNDPQRAQSVTRICSELEGIRSILAKNGALPQPEVFDRLLAILIGVSEVSFAQSSQASSLASQPLSNDFLDWARQQFTENEIVAGVEEIGATGGLELRDFLPELQQAAQPHE
ncbi:MAG TPA: hypothetical protein VGZ47_19670 [Gemmataceae bacterium]|jgi:hypothetical protein|nr:hypothetical protein [Gemmataceae bacterium]